MKLAYVSAVRLNPYVELLAKGVRQVEPSWDVTTHHALTWRLALHPRLRIVHLHWIELQYRRQHEGLARSAYHALTRRLRFLQRRRVHIVYTVHNLNQHEGQFPALNEAANRWLSQHADAIHVHDVHTARAFTDRYTPSTTIYMAPHGHYIDAYPHQATREIARQWLQIPSNAFLYLYLGQIRPYKGIEDLIEAFCGLSSPHATLLIAGHVGHPDYGQTVRDLCASDPRIRLQSSYIADHELQYYYNAADICVLPYKKATTSGAAFLAMSFAKPVIAPNLGPFSDLIAPDRGIVYSPDGEGLDAALREATRLDIKRASAAAYAFARAHSWQDIGHQHVSAYHALLTG